MHCKTFYSHNEFCTIVSFIENILVLIVLMQCYAHVSSGWIQTLEPKIMPLLHATNLEILVSLSTLPFFPSPSPSIYCNTYYRTSEIHTVVCLIRKKIILGVLPQFIPGVSGSWIQTLEVKIVPLPHASNVKN